MSYTIKAIPTTYRGVEFRSRLEARWAAFFDLAGWKWEYEPIDLDGWIPDFRVQFACGHSECPPAHTLLVEVKPYFDLREFNGHPCMDYPYGWKAREVGPGERIPADASAAFGANPDVTYWEMVHGSGGGEESVDTWVRGDTNALWNKAGAKVRYRHKHRRR